MKNAFISLIAGAAIGFSLVGAADAHPGALNAAGCHRDVRHHSYHCHSGSVRHGAHRRFAGWGGGVHDFHSRYGRHSSHRRH